MVISLYASVRSPPAARKFSTGNATGNLQPNSNLSPPARNRSRSRSPAAQRKSNAIVSPELCQVSYERQSESKNLQNFIPQQTTEKTFLTASPSLVRRSMSPSPRRLTDIRKKQTSLEAPATQISAVQIPLAVQDEPASCLISEAKIDNGTVVNDGANKYENISDNGSEISDEGYRSLGLIQSNNAKRISLHSQVSNEDAETNGES
jgi:hypothetical protein